MLRVLTLVFCSAAIVATTPIALRPDLRIRDDPSAQAVRGSGAVASVLWATSPYVGLAVLALLARRGAARWVLAATLLIAVPGVLLLWLLHQPPPVGPSEALGFIPIGQWVLVALATMVAVHFGRLGDRPTSTASNPIASPAALTIPARLWLGVVWVCAAAIVLTISFGIKNRIEWLLILWATAPYWGLALLAFFLFRRPWPALSLLIATLLIAVPALILEAHGDSHDLKGLSFLSFMIIPLLQWAHMGVFVVAAWVGAIVWYWARPTEAPLIRLKCPSCGEYAERPESPAEAVEICDLCKVALVIADPAARPEYGG
jgi:hypothetical protein